MKIEAGREKEREEKIGKCSEFHNDIAIFEQF